MRVLMAIALAWLVSCVLPLPARCDVAKLVLNDPQVVGVVDGAGFLLIPLPVSDLDALEGEIHEVSLRISLPWDGPGTIVDAIPFRAQTDTIPDVGGEWEPLASSLVARSGLVRGVSGQARVTLSLDQMISARRDESFLADSIVLAVSRAEGTRARWSESALAAIEANPDAVAVELTAYTAPAEDEN